MSYLSWILFVLAAIFIGLFLLLIFNGESRDKYKSKLKEISKKEAFLIAYSTWLPSLVILLVGSIIFIILAITII